MRLEANMLNMLSSSSMVTFAGLLLSYAFLSTSGSSAIVPGPSIITVDSGPRDGRLRREAIPIDYTVEVQPDIYGSLPFTFNGKVIILVRCVMAGYAITLNSKFLAIDSASVEVDPSSPVSSPSPNLKTIELDPERDFLTLKFSELLVPNATYILQISYTGMLLTPDKRGIYYDFYTDSEENVKYMVVTQFESIFARQMFPCFDEPDLKATFSVVVLRKEPMISLSNMNQIKSETRDGDWIADYYAKTPIMSTYLVCICIGEFQYVETNWKNHTSYPIRIYSRVELLGQLSLAAKIAAPIQAWLEREHGIPYKLPKMDHIVVPSKTGAMENWGLVTYGESVLCYDPSMSTVSTLLSAAEVVAHELSHQWNGNLVTAKWWNDIWLNEGTATHFNYYPLEVLGWNSSQLQQIDSRRGLQQFLDFDQLNTSDPVIKNIDTVFKAPSSFSGSTYPKGGAIWRMLRGIMGAATVRKGLAAYFTKYSYKPATTDNLWTELSNQAARDLINNPDGSALDVKSVMDPWMKQMGYPLVTIRNLGDGSAVITAERYLNPKQQIAGTASPYNYQFNIPITVATIKDTDWSAKRPSFYLNIGSPSALITGLPVGFDNWFIINVNQMFFYRCKYDSNTRAAIVKQLLADHSKISPESRCQQLSDSFSLSRRLDIPEVRALEMTRYLSKELSFNPWSPSLDHFLFLDSILQDYPFYSDFKVYVKSLVKPVYKIVGNEFTETQSPLEHLLRQGISSVACYYGVSDCIDYVRDLYYTNHESLSENRINPNMLPTVLCFGVSDASETEWTVMDTEYQQRRRSPITDERQAFLYAMTCTKDKSLLYRYLMHIIDGQSVENRDQTTALKMLAANRISNTIVWNYLKDNWDAVPSTIGKFTVLRSVIGSWYKQADLVEFNQFASNFATPATRSRFALMSLLIQQNIDYVTSNINDIQSWLANMAHSTGPEYSEPTFSLPCPPKQMSDTSERIA